MSVDVHQRLLQRLRHKQSAETHADTLPTLDQADPPSPNTADSISASLSPAQRVALATARVRSLIASIHSEEPPLQLPTESTCDYEAVRPPVSTTEISALERSDRVATQIQRLYDNMPLDCRLNAETFSADDLVHAFMSDFNARVTLDSARTTP